MGSDPRHELDRNLDRLLAAFYADAEEGGRLPETMSGDRRIERPERIGPYRISELIGIGGTSLVWRGHDELLGRDVAIKVLDPGHWHGGGLARRFLAEARLCSQLSHPGIVPVHGFGRLPDGRPYFAMRLVEGRTLAALLDARSNPDDGREEWLATFSRVCETVAFAHARGIVHGDLKPGNVMVGAFGQVHVMDWGFSRVLGGIGAVPTGRVAGTPAYMAPELADPHDTIDARADVFGLGAILCEILTGAPPFLGSSRSEVFAAVAHGRIADAILRLDASGADPELVRLANDCLAVRVDERPSDAGKVEARLGAWFASIEERARRLQIEAAGARATAEEQRRTRRRTNALATLVCFSVVCLAWLLCRHQAMDYEARMAMVQSIEKAQSQTDLGNALLLHGDVDQAMAAFRRAHDTNPHDTRPLEGLVDLTRCLGAPAEALEISRAAVLGSPETAGCWRVYGDALLAEGRLREASDAFHRAAELEDNRVNRERLAQCLLELGDLDAAAVSFDAAIGHDPTSTGAVAGLGSTRLLQGHFTEAIAAFERGRESGSSTWAPRCEALIGDAERLVAAERALARLRATVGTAVPCEVRGDHVLAAHLTGRSLLAAELYELALERGSALADGRVHGWASDWGVRAAFAVAAGTARDAQDLAPGERTRWRDRGIAWLRDSIAHARTVADHGEEAPMRIRMRIDLWRSWLETVGDAGRRADGDLAELEAALGAGEPAATVHAPFDSDYSLRKLGPVPGVLMPYGGLVFGPADDELLMGGHAQRRTGGLYAVSLRRDGRGHVAGFRGTARRIASTPFIDGGLAYVEGRATLFYTCWPMSEIGQLPTGGREPERVDKLPVPSPGGLGFVPEGLPGAGRVKVLAWPGGQWFDAELVGDPGGRTVGRLRQIVTLDGGPDGFAWVTAGSPHFDRPAIVVAEWSRHAIATYALDSRGDPVIESRRLVVSGIRGALGLAIDPRTGDLLISTWRGDGSEQIAVLEGFGR